ncbi:MAG: ribosome maturation factor RimM [Bacillota bacterium]|nr:ribosome maturation factor RimM [Bacillota bacterium]
MIHVGKIVAAHGIRGEVKVAPYTDNPCRFKKGGKLFVEKRNEYLTIASCRVQGDDILLVRFVSIEDRNEAESMKGSMLSIPKEKAAPLPAGQYYFFQLEGLTVEEENGNTIGIVSDLVEGGAHDIYRIDCGNGDYTQIPALKSIVTKIDLERGVMTVKLPPGLLEACTYHEN